MAFLPIAYTIPQYDKVKLKNWWLKAYEPGTTTPKFMSTDETGGTLASRFELNSEGFPVTSGGANVIPHIDGPYDLWLFPTAAEADANDTTNAEQFADNIDPAGGNQAFFSTHTAALTSDEAAGSADFDTDDTFTGQFFSAYLSTDGGVTYNKLPSSAYDITGDYAIRLNASAGAIAGDVAHVEQNASESANIGGSSVFFNDYEIETDTTLHGEVRLFNSVIRPLSGITVTIASDCFVVANRDWQDTSAGGSFVLQAGCWEQRIPEKVTSPTGSFTQNIGWPGNTVDESSGGSFVYGGTSSFPHTLGPSSQLCVIGGGYDNVIVNDAIASTIAGGAHHIIKDGASHSSIVGGSYQTSWSDYAFLGGGTLNTVASHYSVCCGGQSNKVGDENEVSLDYRSAFNGAGAENEVYGLRSFNGAGQNNDVLLAAENAANVSGNNNTVSGVRGFNGAGSSNTVSGEGAFNGAGTANQPSGLYSMTNGASCSASGLYARAEGDFCAAVASRSIATGGRSKADKQGQRAHGNRFFSRQGDCQLSDLVAFTTTTGSQSKTLDLLGGESTPITIPDNTTWVFKVNLVARNIDTDGENGAWEYTGAIKKDATAGSAALIGAVQENVISAPVDWTASITAGTSGGTMDINVDTAAPVVDDVRWVARVELVEVGG